ncbi:hypothetical protein I3843_02G143500 [Carya illinoinensis]|nr:hypothetical protein I3760_02G165500 [Carya illinoinensis]KAG7992760.1 hypothetical protein I3843_02G143500 [Carya illinoinensis]
MSKVSRVSRRHVIPTKFIELDDYAYGLDVFLKTKTKPFIFAHHLFEQMSKVSRVSRRHVIPTKFIELDDYAYGLDVFLKTKTKPLIGNWRNFISVSFLQIILPPKHGLLANF